MSASLLKTSGYVFNIQHYSVHDGPGIRTIIFLKGCPLRCKWCCNPESQLQAPELAYNEKKCITVAKCGWCIKECKFGALSEGEDGKVVVDRHLCTNCLACVGACPSSAMHAFGKMMTVEEVLGEVEKDSMFYGRSGGGMTLSGGEPLMQGDFVYALLQECKKRHIDATMETCGFADWEEYARVAPLMKGVLYDVKSMDDEKHKQYTGVSNQKILENLKRLNQEFPHLKLHVRTPVVPGFNDSEEEIAAIAAFVKTLQNATYELLPYHRMGQQKYAYLNREYELEGLEQLDETQVKTLRDIANL